MPGISAELVRTRTDETQLRETAALDSAGSLNVSGFQSRERRVINESVPRAKPKQNMSINSHISDEYESTTVSGASDEQDVWSRKAIARLSPGQISFLPDETLVEVIDRTCDFLPQPEVRERLCYLDREALERLAYLVRQACRRRGY